MHLLFIFIRWYSLCGQFKGCISASSVDLQIDTESHLSPFYMSHTSEAWMWVAHPVYFDNIINADNTGTITAPLHCVLAQAFILFISITVTVFDVCCNLPVLHKAPWIAFVSEIRYINKAAYLDSDHGLDVCFLVSHSWIYKWVCY